MAITAITILKGWFAAGKYPTAAQFGSLIDSFRHKSDKVEISEVNKLPEALNEKCGVAWGAKINENINRCVSGWKLMTDGYFLSSGYDLRVRMIMGFKSTNELVVDPYIMEFSYDEIKAFYDSGVTTINLEGKSIHGDVVVYLDVVPYVADTLELVPRIVDENNQLIKLYIERSQKLTAPML